MILFKPEHKAMILNGTKTVTRRFWKKRRAVPGAIHQACLAFSGPGRKPFALLRILEAYEERIKDISNEDVKAEGYKTRDEYFRVLFEINNKGMKWDELTPVGAGTRMNFLGMTVWVVRFKVEEVCDG